MGIIQPNAARRDSRLDGGLPVSVEGRGLGKCSVESAWCLWRPRQRAPGRRVRGLQGPQARPQNAGVIAEVLIVLPGTDDEHNDGRAIKEWLADALWLAMLPGVAVLEQLCRRPAEAAVKRPGVLRGPGR